jgi:dihydroorotate dehydrogenase
MPDYTYHPFLKPLLFHLPVEFSRRLTLRLLEIQARTAFGRWVFRLFGHGLPPKELSTTVFGLQFPGPIGLGPGIDIEGTAIPVMQYLGFGFITVGPLGAEPVPRDRSTDPLRDVENLTLVHSAAAGVPNTHSVAERLKHLPDLGISVGIALRGENLAAAIDRAHQHAAFFTLPASIIESPRVLKELRAKTEKPLLLRLSPHWEDEAIHHAIRTAKEAGINGVVATAGFASDRLPQGEIDSPALFERSLAVIRLIQQSYGDACPIIAAGGIRTPEQAVQMLDAGAKLVELGAGLVFAGPGLPGRIVHLLQHRAKNPCESPKAEPAARPTEDLLPWRASSGAACIALTGLILVLSGLFAIILAATVKLLPYDIAYLGMTMKDLCDQDQCRIVHFMAHDRVSFGGSIISIGLVYLWLAWIPLRNGEAWSWWTLLLSGIAGFGSFLTYLGYGYLDLPHAIATVLLLIVFVSGLWISFQRLRGSRHIRTLKIAGSRAWLWSDAGLGRAYLLFTAFGMISGGLTIMLVGMTVVFVPQDLEYMQVTREQIHAINPRLIPLIAHDRAGFGGGLCSGGIAIALAAWCGLRPGARGLWWIFLFSGVIGFGTSIGVHPIVGYNSFIHLLPAYVGAITFLLAMKYLYAPVVCGKTNSDFPPL